MKATNRELPNRNKNDTPTAKRTFIKASFPNRGNEEGRQL